VAKVSPQSKAEIGKLAESLYKSGKRGAELEQALKAASLEASGLGKNPAPELVAEKMLTLGAVTTKWKDNLRDVFSGPRTKAASNKILGFMGSMVEKFGETTVEGQALQALVSTVMAPLGAGIKAIMPLANQFFRGMIIAALDVSIAVMKAGLAIKKALPDDAVSGWLTVESAVTAGKVAFYAVLIVLALVVGAFLIVVAAVASCIVALAAIPTTLALGVAAVVAFAVAVGVAIVSAVQYLATLGSAAVSAASDLIQGLINGIRSGAGAVAEAVTAMAKGAVSALKGALGISSPSKVFAIAGTFSAEGFIEGVEAEADAVDATLESMIDIPPVSYQVGTEMPTPPPVAEVRTPAQMTAGPSMQLTGLTFNFYGVEGAEDAQAKFVEALTKIVEGDVIAMGGAV
jgi:hypothetical protein